MMTKACLLLLGILVVVNPTIRCDVADTWTCPSNIAQLVSNTRNFLNNPGFDTPRQANAASTSPRNYNQVNFDNNGGNYLLSSDTSPAHSNPYFESFGAPSMNLPNIIEYQETDGTPGGPNTVGAGQPLLFSFFARGTGKNPDSAALFVKWNGATIQDSAVKVEQSTEYKRYCLPVALIGDLGRKNSLQMGGFDSDGSLSVDDLSLNLFGQVYVSYTTTSTSTLDGAFTQTTTVQVTSTTFTSTATTALVSSTITPTTTFTPPAVTNSVAATSTSTVTQTPVTVTSSTLSCTQAHLTFASACCPRSFCKSQATPAPMPHRRSMNPNKEGELDKREILGTDTATITITNGQPVTVTTGQASVTFISTVTTTTTITTTLSTVSTSTIPSTVVTATSTSTVTLPPSTKTTTYTTITSTSTVTPAASTVGACQKEFRVPQFQCPSGLRQQAALSAFELALLQQYKKLAPKAFPSILVSCQGDPIQYIY